MNSNWSAVSAWAPQASLWKGPREGEAQMNGLEMGGQSMWTEQA